jgi:hypothetical protein
VDTADPNPTATDEQLAQPGAAGPVAPVDEDPSLPGEGEPEPEPLGSSPETPGGLPSWLPGALVAVAFVVAIAMLIPAIQSAREPPRETVGAAQTENISASQTESVGGAKTESVGAAQTESVGASQAESVGAAQSEDVDGESDSRIISYSGLEGEPPERLAQEVGPQSGEGRPTETLSFYYQKVDASGYQEWTEVRSIGWTVEKPGEGLHGQHDMDVSIEHADQADDLGRTKIRFPWIDVRSGKRAIFLNFEGIKGEAISEPGLSLDFEQLESSSRLSASQIMDVFEALFRARAGTGAFGRLSMQSGSPTQARRDDEGYTRNYGFLIEISGVSEAAGSSGLSQDLQAQLHSDASLSGGSPEHFKAAFEAITRQIKDQLRSTGIGKAETPDHDQTQTIHANRTMVVELP